MKSSFKEDSAWSSSVSDRILLPGLYEVRSYNGRFIKADKGRMATKLQRECAVDVLMQSAKRGGELVAIEEKIVRWPGYAYTCFALETHSCTIRGREEPGWMWYGQADYLLYCFMREDGYTLDCHMIDFPALQKWFRRTELKWDQFGPLNTGNASQGRKVPIRAVQLAVASVAFTLVDPLRPAGIALTRQPSLFDDDVLAEMQREAEQYAATHWDPDEAEELDENWLLISGALRNIGR